MPSACAPQSSVPLFAGPIVPATAGGFCRICSAISRRLISTSLGNSKATRTRSPLIDAIRTIPIGLRGSPMTTSSPSRRVITNIGHLPSKLSRHSSRGILRNQSCPPRQDPPAPVYQSPFLHGKYHFANRPIFLVLLGPIIAQNMRDLLILAALKRFPQLQITAFTDFTSGTCCFKLRSIPTCSVMLLLGHPTHAPCNRISATPSGVIRTNSTSPPSA